MFKLLLPWCLHGLQPSAPIVCTGAFTVNQAQAVAYQQVVFKLERGERSLSGAMAVDVLLVPYQTAETRDLSSAHSHRVGGPDSACKFALLHSCFATCMTSNESSKQAAAVACLLSALRMRQFWQCVHCSLDNRALVVALYVCIS
jgi:hypothetical protein